MQDIALLKTFCLFDLHTFGLNPRFCYYQDLANRKEAGTYPGVNAVYYKLSKYIYRKFFMSLYPAPEESGFYGHVG